MKLDRSMPPLALATLLVAALAAPLAAHAAPITVSAGQTLLFNADMTGLAPPPFLDVQFRTQLVAGSFDSAVDQGIWTFYTGLDGQGSATQIAQAGLTSTQLSDAGFLDGLFSATFQMVAGEVEIAPDVRGVVDIGNNETGFTEALPLRASDPPVNGVPGPTSPALALLALGGLLLARARRRGA